jgi:hypothetical protein
MRSGGTSFLRVLRNHFDLAAIYPNGSTAPVQFEKMHVNALMELSADVRGAYKLFAVHMPAWVADEVAPDALKVSVLREPVERTVSHLRQIARHNTHHASGLDTVYADREIRDRLANYQTRLFGLTRRHWEEENRLAAAGLATISTEQGSQELRRALASSMIPYMATAIHSGRSLDESDLTAAIERLHTFDVIGTTDTLPLTVGAMRSRLRLALKVPRQQNAATDALRPSEELLEAIRRDNAMDTQLYHQALDLARDAQNVG